MAKHSLPVLIAAAVLYAPGHALASPPEAAGLARVPDDRFAAFTPRPSGREDRLDFSVWSEALAAYVVSMGPPLRKMPPGGAGGSRRFGHNSIYRLEGAMVGFDVMDAETIANIARYRRELEALADQIDIQSLPRNEQLAYWFNLHNVALVEQIGAAWPVYVPREIMVAEVPLDEARFVTVKGVPLSPREIRERIVFANWRSPAVIYGFWRGEIGGPAMQRRAFQGLGLSAQLDSVAREFANSRRGVERRGGTLHVSRLYAEAAPFFFPDFEADLRTHLAAHVEGKVAEMLPRTETVKASLYEHDIADLSGGRRPSAFYRDGRLSPPVLGLLAQRARKLEYIRRTRPRTYTVTFSNIDLPGDPPEKNEIE
ncbi:DUF547 domain-containing protein [Erythrobacter donghaensis]|uniref:DUF547 domain-containing protein n=1 Tax=Erythrobacter donghaensis TaxID=267135 RepID=UPI00117FF8F5|nr:DUF547 domain-containing protein [Erythrobacter donghaensis]